MVDAIRVMLYKGQFEVSAMKRFCAWFGILILLLPAVPDLDDAIALQDGWFNVDPSDDVISKSPHGLKSADDDSGLAASLHQLDHIQTVSPYVLPLEFFSGRATSRDASVTSQTLTLSITGRSPPLS